MDLQKISQWGKGTSGIISTMHPKTIANLLGNLAIVTLLNLPVSAALFTAQTNFPCQGISTLSQLNSPVFLDTGFKVCATAGGDLIGQGGAAARANSLGVGAGVEMLAGPFNQIAVATGRIDTQFMVLGPGTEPITLSINFLLTGFLGGGTNQGTQNRREIYNEVTIEAGRGNILPAEKYSYFGRAVELFNIGLNPGLSVSLSGQLAPQGEFCLKQNATEPCGIVTPTFQVLPGQVNTLSMLVRAEVQSDNGAFGFGIADSLNTFKFDPNKPVFNMLPDGYTVEVEGMSVVNNRVVDPNGSGQVPEPSTYLLAGSALALAILLRRR